MRDATASATPETIYLKDYTPPAYLVDHVTLDFALDPEATRVKSRIAFRPNPEASDTRFFLHGEQLKLIWATIDGKSVATRAVPGGIEADVPNAPFVWEAEVEIAPASNTALEGLYMSNGMYCTQCEAEGFRKITYYPDRPDVMATFDVTIQSDLPVLLSNGNPTGAGQWHDPWPKPAYLFALVAGDLHATSGSFTTMEGREVELNIYVRDGDQDKTAFAMEALKLSMKWDEDVYKRAYDLDIFNIVAVDDFNMGAMENKGLNIFNSSAVLASPETATDTNFERIEAIIAHEYFHNWTGNRITCRDWFQLCLKEGLTVYRDQQFTADVRSASVARIENVLGLRAAQFREDNGPLAHPVRPESFVEINNFYTATVYEKGAEVIGMLRTLVGAEAYDQALQLYFERHDGEACTIEDWLQVFEDSTGRDLSQFKQWYSQAGTPRVTVEEAYSGDTFSLTFTQSTPPTPGQDTKAPQLLPLNIGLIAPDGSEAAPTVTFEMTEATQTLTFAATQVGWSPLHLSQNTQSGTGHAQPHEQPRPIPSVNRNFSAPIILNDGLSDADRLHLLAHDTDPFNRWDAGRQLMRGAFARLATEGTAPETGLLTAIRDVVANEALDAEFRALVLSLPSEDDIAQAIFDAGQTPDPTAIHRARETLVEALADTLQDVAPVLYAAHQVPGPYTPAPGAVASRALANAALGLINRRDGGAAALAQLETADNMTNEFAALCCLVRIGKADQALADFYAKWRHERLVIDKWFSVQTSLAPVEAALDVARKLTQHPDFTMKTPNRFRACMYGFAGNTAAFHAEDGSGYAFVGDWLARLDALNPQAAARMTTVFSTLKRYDPDRQAHMRAALEAIRDTDGLSRDTTEMVLRLLG
ncbi:MAG: aminopeptidase N [Pseudomonadota bacterium]